MATSANSSQLGVQGITELFALWKTSGVTQKLPTPQNVAFIDVDGSDVRIVTNSGLETILSMNADMELDFLNHRINLLSVVNLDRDVPANLNDVLVHDGTGFAPVPQSELTTEGEGGYEFTGGFTDRTTGSAGANDTGSNVQYTASQAASNTWVRFGFDRTRQTANDNEYWGETNPDFDQSKGLFGGLHMPPGVTELIDFDFDDSGTSGGFSDALTTGSNPYTAATGSYDLSQCDVGDLVKVRFSFNAVPQIANSTLEVGLIFATRDANDNITFTFPLTTQPVYYGTGTQGQGFLNRVEMSAYIASNEDVNARLLPAIRCNNEILIQPLSTLISIIR